VQTSAGPIAGEALIAADGINTRFRPLVAPDGDRLQPSGYAAHRSLVPRSALPPHVFRDEVILWAGEGYHIVAYPLRDDTMYNIVTVFQTETYAQRQDADDHRREVEAKYRDAHPDMQVLLGQLNLERRWPISDRKPIRQWTAGRVALLGDAAHATLQSLAQGAGMSIEDGVCIAACLATTEPVAAALQRYQSLRRTRTARVQLESRSLWETYHCGGIAAEVRRETFANRTEREYYDCLEWLYADPRRTMEVGSGAYRQAIGSPAPTFA
jgi:salicylate hydroxylase